MIPLVERLAREHCPWRHVAPHSYHPASPDQCSECSAIGYAVRAALREAAGVAREWTGCHELASFLPRLDCHEGVKIASAIEALAG